MIDLKLSKKSEPIPASMAVGSIRTLPAPQRMLSWFSAVTSSNSDNHSAWLSGDVVEWAAHAILMGGVAYHLIPMFGGSTRWLVSLLCSMFVISVKKAALNLQ